MAFNFRRAVFSFLRRFKERDVLLRDNSTYEYISHKTLNAVRTALGMRRVLHRKLVAHHYVKNFDLTDVDENMAFFDCFWGRKVGGDPYAIYKAMVRRRPDLKVVWVKNKGVSTPDDVADNVNVDFVEHDSKEYADALLTAKYLICNSNFLPFFVKKNKQVFINTWHGIPLKRLGLDIDQAAIHSMNTQRNFNVADIIPVAGEYEFDNVVRAYGAACYKGNVYYVGSPRVDLTITASRGDVLRRLGVGEGKRVLLYAPTWRGSIFSVSSQIDDQLQALQALEENLGQEYEILVSLHHLTRKSVKERNLQVNMVPDTIDINELLQVVDVLISDYSSILVDFLVLDRPVVLYVPDYEAYRLERGMYVELSELPCSVVYSANSLVDEVRKLKRPSAYPLYGNMMSRFLPKEDGGASDRVVDLAFGGMNNLPKSRDKKSILIFPGSLKANGITSAFKSLLSFLAHIECDVYVVVDPKHEKGIASFKQNLEFIVQNAKVIFISQVGSRKSSEYLALKKFTSRFNEFSSVDESVLRRMFDREVMRHLPEARLDCVVDFSGYSYYWSRFVSAIPAGRKIIYQHSDMKAEADNSLRGHKYLRQVFYNYQFFDRVASVSGAIKEVNESSLADHYKGAVCISIPNLVDFNMVAEKSMLPLEVLCPELASIPESSMVYISVSRLSVEKNLHMLLESFSLVAKQNEDAVLVIVGDGGISKSLVSAAAELGVYDQVIFTGHVDNPYPLMRRADCLVFPSLYEGQGLVLMEAMSLGTYCIGSDIPAVREVLQDTGCLVVKPDVQSFASAMLSVGKESNRLLNFSPEKYYEMASERMMDAFFND